MRMKLQRSATELSCCRENRLKHRGFILNVPKGAAPGALSDQGRDRTYSMKEGNTCLDSKYL